MPGIKPGLAGSERLIAILMELDATTGFRSGTAAADPFPPAVLGPAANTDWAAVHADRERDDRILDESYDGNVERVGSNWIRARWYGSEWRAALGGPLGRLRAADPGADRFADDDLIAGLLATLDEKRTGDEEVNRARLNIMLPRTTSIWQRESQLIASGKPGAVQISVYKKLRHALFSIPLSTSNPVGSQSKKSRWSGFL